MECSGTIVTYQLSGIIYYNEDHFTSRIVKPDGSTWYHDGVSTKTRTLYEGNINYIEDIENTRKKKAVAAIYIKQ